MIISSKDVHIVADPLLNEGVAVRAAVKINIRLTNQKTMAILDLKIWRLGLNLPSNAVAYKVLFRDLLHLSLLITSNNLL
jgi:hypothetical protein